MSLDCYPFSERRTMALGEQPMAIDAAYDSDLLVTVIDDCQTVVVFDLRQASQADLLVGQFQLGADIVIDQVAHCKAGNFIACVGHKDSQRTVYVVFDWHTPPKPSPTTKVAESAMGERQSHPTIEELNLNEMTIPLDEKDRRDKLSSIAVCQATGNLAASYGDLVVVYRYVDARLAEPSSGNESQGHEGSWLEITSSPEDLANDLARLLAGNNNNNRCSHFKHLASVKLSIWAARVALTENFLSIMSADHVQVLKLEILTLQIQSDGHEDYLAGLQGAEAQQQQQPQLVVSRSAGSSGESRATTATLRDHAAHRAKRTGRAGAQVGAALLPPGTTGAPPPAPHDETSGDEDTSACASSASSCSLASGSASDQSLVTDFSAFTGGTEETETGEPGACPADATGDDGGAARQVDHNREEQEDEASQQGQLTSNIDSDMSIITMQNLSSTGLSSAAQAASLEPQQAANDDCITWNLNTKKLVKLPTLMHNTSTDLASYHICHPLELLGPASESIACRVSARIYAPDLAQNQLEPVVLLCKQFDFDRDPVKQIQLEPMYFSQPEDQRRLARGAAGAPTEVGAASWVAGSTPSGSPGQLLKSRDYELLASVSCFVATLTNCYVYSLAGKKVTRLQTITYPGLCLDLRADLLNVYLLTPLGLQICSTSICDATFRYDWSSSADLNLSFLARDRVRALTTSQYLVMVSSSSSSELAGAGGASYVKHAADVKAPADIKRPGDGSFLEVLRKPSLGELIQRIGHTIQRCQSISVRSNLLTYLHASAQLCLMEIEKKHQRRVATDVTDEHPASQEGALVRQAEQQEVVSKLKNIAILLAKQLLQKKQTNVITNSRIDRAIKHLLDISFCDVGELLRRHMLSSGGGASSPEVTQSARPQMADGFMLDASAEVGEEERGIAMLPPAKVERTKIDKFSHFEDVQSDHDADEHDCHDKDDADDDDEPPEDSDAELLKIYLKHGKFNQALSDCLKSLASGASVSDDPNTEERSTAAFDKLIALMFDYNPRMLIKCAQRITRDGEPPGQAAAAGLSNKCLAHLISKLKQLAELDSTGINRATVLFTLAILYHEAAARGPLEGEIAGDGDKQVTATCPDAAECCLKALGQIKPQNHLAITMCSNHDTINDSMARLVEAHHPHVYRLFVSQLEKRGELAAARHFQRLSESAGSREIGKGDKLSLGKEEGGDSNQRDCGDHSEDEGDGDEEAYEANLRLLARFTPLELAELFWELSREGDKSGASRALADDAEQRPTLFGSARTTNEEGEDGEDGEDGEADKQAMRDYLRASVDLMESRFILARLCENSR